MVYENPGETKLRKSPQNTKPIQKQQISFGKREYIP